ALHWCTTARTLVRTVLILSSRPAVRHLHSFPTRRSSDLEDAPEDAPLGQIGVHHLVEPRIVAALDEVGEFVHHHVFKKFRVTPRSEEHTSELQSRENLVCRLLLEKKKENNCIHQTLQRAP